MKKKFPVLLVGTGILLLTFFYGCGSSTPNGKNSVGLTFLGDPLGKLVEINQSMADEFEKKTGIKVKIEKGSENSTERLAQIQNFLSAKTSEIDIYQIDVIWPGMIGEHMIDLHEKIDEKVFFPAIIKNNTFQEKLIAAPFFADAGLLYYRADLLAKYGFTNPPDTWDELETMAKKIMEGERKDGNSSFWGYVFQGAAYEGLMCNALEWQTSEEIEGIFASQTSLNLTGDGSILAADRAASWVSIISPPGVTTYKEEESRNVWQSGNAAFMRNWPYAYTLGQNEGSLIKGKFDIARIPAGKARYAATLGGWQLGISQYSKHQKEAIEFVKFLTSTGAQKRRAIEGGYIPVSPEVYDDEEVIKARPYFRLLREIFTQVVSRPSVVIGKKYNEVSAAYYSQIHQTLSGQETASAAMSTAENRIKEIISR
ncbi:ABC transporter substrate-binding protein [bacterium]|nr:ABC transporter substrate-binding protein [bacterium]